MLLASEISELGSISWPGALVLCVVCICVAYTLSKLAG